MGQKGTVNQNQNKTKVGTKQYMTKNSKIIYYAATNPGATTKQIAKAVGASKRHVRRVKAELQNREGAPKILLFDVETSPMEVYCWGLYKQRIDVDRVIKDWALLSWSAKWLFDDVIMSDRVSTKEATNRDDSSIIKGVWDLLNEADVVIAHNALKFDVRKLNARFLMNGLGPTLPYQVVDTLKVAQRNFALSSAKLDSIAGYLGLEKKDKTEYELWVRCVTGDDSAIKEMETYNRQDVVVLEEVYVALRPWIKSHPNFSLYVETDQELCPTCGSTELNWKGHYYTTVGKYKSFRCSNCKSIGRSRYSDLTKEKRKVTLAPVAR